MPHAWISQFAYLLALCAVFHGGGAVRSTADDASSPELELSPARIDALDPVLTTAIRDALASPYVDEKKWGKKKNLTVGVRLERDGIVLRPKRRRKDVNHGEWERYEIKLDPAKKDKLKLETVAVRRGNETTRGSGMEIDAKLDLPLVAHARFANWRRGVQLYSIAVDATAVVKVKLTIQVEGTLDTSRFPPKVGIRPRVTKMHVELAEFRLHKISDARGPLVRQFGKLMEDVANKQLKKRKERLIEKINRKLEKI